MTPTPETPTLAAQIEALAAIVANVPVSAMVGRCGWKTHSAALDGLRSALADTPAIVTALRQAEAAPGVVDAEAKRIADLSHDHGSIAWCAAYDAVKAALARQHEAREPGRPIGTEPHACSVLGGRFNEAWGGWTFAVVNTPMVQPFTHWWPLPGFDDAEIVLLPAALASRQPAGEEITHRHRIADAMMVIAKSVMEEGEQSFGMTLADGRRVEVLARFSDRQPAGIEKEALTRQHGAREGWVLVPREPTDAMTWAGQKLRYPSANSITVIWQAMIAAAPATEQHGAREQ